jgi:hypothetical protein
MLHLNACALRVLHFSVCVLRVLHLNACALGVLHFGACALRGAHVWLESPNDATHRFLNEKRDSSPSHSD